MLLKANWNNECHWNVQNYGPSQGLHGWQGPQGLGLAWILQNRKRQRRQRALLWYGGLACQKLAVAALHLQWALHHFSHENRVPKCGLMNCCDSQTTNISNLRMVSDSIRDLQIVLELEKDHPNAKGEGALVINVVGFSVLLVRKGLTELPNTALECKNSWYQVLT